MSDDLSETSRIGWIGTGVMGARMCARMIAAGYAVNIFNRTKSRAADLIRAGAVWRRSPAEVAASSDAIFTMLSFPADVRDVIFGESGVFGGAARGSLLIDMSTSDPRLAQEIYEVSASKGIDSLDAPVSGGDIGARDGTLAIMVGGTESGFSRALPLFAPLGKTVVHAGAPGAGQHLKIVNQIALASAMIGVSEALLYAHRCGLEIEQAIKTVGAGASASWLLDNLAPRMASGEFDSGGRVELFIKDLGIALTAARELKLRLPGLALAEELYTAASDQGLGRRGIHALVLAQAHLSGVEWGAAPA